MKNEYHCILEVCLGKGNLNEIPMHSLGTFVKIVAYRVEIALHVNEQNPSIEICQSKQFSGHKSTGHGCPKWYSDVTNPMELMVWPLEILFSSYGEFHLTSQCHLGTLGKFQPRA